MNQIEGTNDWMVWPIPINNNTINNFFYIADAIIYYIYASQDININGSLIYNNYYNWMEDYYNNPNGNLYYITYAQDLGFALPSISYEISGTTGRNLGLAGIRISSIIPDVGIEVYPHAKNYGWLTEENSNE